MLIQTPSKIFKYDFRIWNEIGNAVATKFLNNEAHSGKLIGVTEVVLEENADYKLVSEGANSILLFPLYGEIIINGYYETITAGETLVLNNANEREISLKNHLPNDKSDVLIFEFKDVMISENFIKHKLNFNSHNNLMPLAESISTPNFIGIYDGRSEGFYTLKDKNKAIFGMVVQGAFEFQNRLLETRDAILLWEIEELEFEALSENALILFFEI